MVKAIPNIPWRGGIREKEMTPEDRARINQLCALIQTEANPQEFTRLVKELKDLLDSKLGPIQGEPPSHSAGSKDQYST